MAATAATVVVAAIVVEFAAVLSAAVAAIVTVVVAAAAVLVHPSWWLVLVLLAVNLSFKIVDGRVSSSRRWRRRSRAACRAPLLPHAACRMGTRWPAQTAECGPGDRRKVWRKVWANRPWAVAATVGSGGDRGLGDRGSCYRGSSYRGPCDHAHARDPVQRIPGSPLPRDPHSMHMYQADM